MSKWKEGEGTGGRVQQLQCPLMISSFGGDSGENRFLLQFQWVRAVFRREWRTQACFRRLHRGRGGDTRLHAEAVRRGLSGVARRSGRWSRVARRSSRRSRVARRGVTVARVGLLGGHWGSRGGQHKLLAWLHKHTNT